LSCIVEGQGDVKSVPLLIRRIAGQVDPALYVDVAQARRVPRSTLVKTGEVEYVVNLAAKRLAGQGGILVLVDSDDDCPKTTAPRLLQRAQMARSDVPIALVLAKFEFEAWFLAAAESIGGRRGLPAGLQPPADPEAIRDAKGWLQQRMHPTNRKYSETADQPALTALFDLNVARQRSNSFDKCYREIERLLQALAKPSQQGTESTANP
jgi:hypothetical protein